MVMVLRTVRVSSPTLLLLALFWKPRTYFPRNGNVDVLFLLSVFVPIIPERPADSGRFGSLYGIVSSCSPKT